MEWWISAERESWCVGRQGRECAEMGNKDKKLREVPRRVLRLCRERIRQGVFAVACI